MERNRIIQTASYISVFGNALLAAAKIAVGAVSGSMSVLGDGLDSLIDVFISLITLVVTMVITHPPDREHPYGHYRAETIATAVLAFIIFFIGAQLSISTADKLISGEPIVMPDIISVYVIVFSIAGKIALAWSQVCLGRKAESDMIIANSKNMLNDIIMSAGVLAGLAFVFFLGMPVFDRILAIIIGIWILYSAVRIFMGTVTEMMDGIPDMDLYNRIFDEVKKMDSLFNPHRVRIRKLGYQYMVDMDIEVAGDTRVDEAHEMVEILEKNIRNVIPNIHDIVIHIEPIGNVEKHERWGLNENHMDNT